MDTEEWVTVQTCGFENIRGNYIGGETITKIDMEIRMKRLKKLKAMSNEEVKGEMKKNG